jgi:hypothetical protein
MVEPKTKSEQVGPMQSGAVSSSPTSPPTSKGGQMVSVQNSPPLVGGARGGGEVLNDHELHSTS